MVREKERKVEGNGESHGEKGMEKDRNVEGNGELQGENGKEKTAERGGKWRVARGEW